MLSFQKWKYAVRDWWSIYCCKKLHLLMYSCIDTWMYSDIQYLWHMGVFVCIRSSILVYMHVKPISLYTLRNKDFTCYVQKNMDLEHLTINSQKRPDFKGHRGQHGAHLGPVGPRWAPCWPHEPCYQGACMNVVRYSDTPRNTLLRFARQHFQNNRTYQDDSDVPHLARIATAFLQQEGVG